MKTIDSEIKFKGKTINVSYNNDDNFKLYFLNQFGILAYKDEVDVRFNEILTKMHGFTTGVMHFVFDNIQLPPNPTIIDIGSGNSFIDLAISKYLNQQANFILIDGNKHNVNPVIHSTEFNTYNSWDMVSDALKLSGIDDSKFQMHDIDYAFDQQVDLIISTNSWGLHYPIDVYLEKVVSALKPGGYLVLFPVININGYKDSVDGVLNSIYTENESNWMREGLDWDKWKIHFPNLADNEPTALRCIWQKPLV
jgi:SAM-dependent methyltransferase